MTLRGQWIAVRAALTLLVLLGGPMPPHGPGVSPRHMAAAAANATEAGAASDAGVAEMAAETAAARAAAAALLRWGATVTDWDSYSPELRSRVPCRRPAAAAGLSPASRTPPPPPRVGYFTRHTGTLWDWMAVAEQLGANWERRNPAALYPKYGMSAAVAEELWRRNGSQLCAPSYDVVVYCDTVVDARPALQGGCGAPLVLQVTNRFDWKVQDLAPYQELMRAAAANPRVWWVTNSPYEALYMAWQGLVLPPERHLMLRPVGATVLPPPSPTISSTSSTSSSSAASAPSLSNPSDPRDRSVSFAVVVKGDRRKHPDRDVLLPQLRSMGLEGAVTVYDAHYGGPAALAQHRGVVHLPYQMSIMGMYELLAEGGVYLLPSPAFFRGLRQRHRFSSAFVPLLLRGATRQADGSRLNWTHFVEWYHPDFSDAMVYFESWEQLAEQMRAPAADPRWGAKRAAARAAMARVRRLSLAGWRRLMGEAAAVACG